jgi:hypothetical protein
MPRLSGRYPSQKILSSSKKRGNSRNQNYFSHLRTIKNLPISFPAADKIDIDGVNKTGPAIVGPVLFKSFKPNKMDTLDASTGLSIV